LAHFVASKLCREWSPEQISGRLKRTYADDETYQVSHETIYRSLFIQAPRGSEEGADGAFAAHTRDAPFATPHAKDPHSRANH